MQIYDKNGTPPKEKHRRPFCGRAQNDRRDRSEEGGLSVEASLADCVKVFPCFFDFDIGNLAWNTAPVGMIEENDCAAIRVFLVSVEPFFYETPLNAPHG